MVSPRNTSRVHNEVTDSPIEEKNGDLSLAPNDGDDSDSVDDGPYNQPRFHHGDR
jgi:hypothetical protein